MTIDQQLAGYSPLMRLQILQAAADKLERERIARQQAAQRQAQIRERNRAQAVRLGHDIGMQIAANIIANAQLQAAQRQAIAQRFPI